MADKHTLVMLQRQMLLIEHIRESLSWSDGQPIGIEAAKQQYVDWPVLEGMPLRDSFQTYRIMEELNLLYGFQQSGGYVFKTTSRYDQWLQAAKGGTFVINPPEPALLDDLSEELQSARLQSENIFVVHGEDLKEDDSLPNRVMQYIRSSFGYEPVFMDIGQNSGYLMENFEKLAASCAVAVCIWTPNRDNRESGSIRPNVTLETGCFLANIGLSRVIVIRDARVKDAPSDLDGRAYLTEENWDRHLSQRIHEALAVP